MRDGGTTPGDEETEKCFCFGYPSKLTEVFGEFRAEGVSVSQVLVWADAVVRANGVHMLQLGEGQVMRSQCRGNFDGFSGGPVFGANTISKSIEFRGTIIWGGHDRLFFVPARWVDKLCDLAVREPPIAVFEA